MSPDRVDNSVVGANQNNDNTGSLSSSSQRHISNGPQVADRREASEPSNNRIRDDQRSHSTRSGENISLLVNKQDSSSRPRSNQVKQWLTRQHHHRHFLQYMLRDTWLYELVAISISVSCLIAIGAVLRVYDGRVSPQLQYGLTLNAIVSILATSTKAGLVYAVASSISQLKWRWVQERARPLEHLQTYDDASRGFSGAFTMLFDRSGRSIASIGAVITILAVALDPFIQQLLAFPIKDTPRPSSSAHTKQATVFDVPFYSPDFLVAVEGAIWSGASQFERQPACPSRNCTWPPFRSVGWCSKCEDVTQAASISGCTFTVEKDFHPDNITDYTVYYRSVPCKISLDQGVPADFPIWGGATAYQNKSAAEVWIDPPTDLVWLVGGSYAAIAQQDSSFYNQTFLGIENPPAVIAHASLSLKEAPHPEKGLTISHVDQCVLSLCERAYEVNVVGGIASDTVQSTNWGAFEPIDLFLAGPHFPTVAGSFQPQQFYWLPDAKDASRASQFLSNGSRFDPNTLAVIVDSYWGQVIGAQITSNKTKGWRWVPGDERRGWYSYGESGSPSTNYSSDAMLPIANGGLESVVGSIAASLTHLALAKNNLTVFGTVGISEVYIQVRWLWFILPCALELAAVGFLMWTIIISKRENVHTWKSSLHALLYHGLDRDLLDRQPVTNSVSEMESMSRSVKVRLTGSKDKARLALRGQ